MSKIRKIKYTEGATSVQVYKVENRKRVIVRHIATVRILEKLTDLITLANYLIKTTTKKLFLFNDDQSNNIINIKQIDFVSVCYSSFHELISKLIIDIGFDKLKNNFLLDLAII